MTTCIHCGGGCRLTDGREIYPHRPDLAAKPIWKCLSCADATVGCHPGTTTALGFAADRATRTARSKLHEQMLDPLWQNSGPHSRVPSHLRKDARKHVYAFLSHHLGIPPEKTHTGMWSLQQCREAWQILRGHTPESIAQWAQAARP